MNFHAQPHAGGTAVNFHIVVASPFGTFLSLGDELQYELEFQNTAAVLLSSCFCLSLDRSAMT